MNALPMFPMFVPTGCASGLTRSLKGAHHA